MALDLTRRAVVDRRRSLLWWTVGVLSYVGFIVAFYPTVRDQAARFNELIASYPKSMMDLFTGGEAIDFGSAPSFLNTYLFASMVPIAVLILAVGFGAATLAGEEGDGTLELVLAYPVHRRSVVLQKALALLAELAVVGIAMAVLILATGPLVELHVDAANLALSTLALVLLGFDFGALALAVGAATGRKGAATGVASGVAAFTYLLSTLAVSVSWLDPFRFLSPFWWASNGQPLANGTGAGRLVVLAGIAVVVLGVAVVAFERRDLRA